MDVVQYMQVFERYWNRGVQKFDHPADPLPVASLSWQEIASALPHEPGSGAAERREAIVMLYRAGLPIKIIAEILGVHINTVNYHLRATIRNRHRRTS